MPDAREIECAVLGNDAPEASIAGEVIPSREFYDYEAKYLDERSQVDHPGGPDAGAGRRRSAAAVGRGLPAIDCAGMARVDFLLVARHRHASSSTR